MTAHIFISYSKRNKQYARSLADHLIASGFDVWIDDRIDYGSLWADVIQKAIEDCAAFIVIMTPDSRESRWVKTECEYATQQGKRVFPLLLAGDVFFRYVSVQYVNVSDESLPPDAFLDELAEVAPRKPSPGANVTAPEAKEITQPASTPHFRPTRRLITLLFGAGIVAALVIAVLLVLQNRSSKEPETHASDGVPTHDAEALVSGPTQESDCGPDWFFGNEHALPGDCPISGADQFEGFIQRFGEGVLIGMDAAQGHYFVLHHDGTYEDIVADFTKSTDRIAACAIETVLGFSEAMSYSGSADEVIGCPVEILHTEEVSYQSSIAASGIVVYLGTTDGGVFRLEAPSSRPGIGGTWRRIQ